MSIITRKEKLGTDITDDVQQTQNMFMQMDKFHGYVIPLHFPLKLDLKQGNLDHW